MSSKEIESNPEETETTEILQDNEKTTQEKPNNLERKTSAFAETVIEVREKKGLMRAAIPTMPRWFAWICLFFNVFVPGLGTFFMSFPTLCGAKTNSKKPNRCVDFLLNLMAASLQLITAVVIVGWIFSISWGMHFVNQANEAHAKKRSLEKNNELM